MISKKEYYEKIVHELSVFLYDIESKASNNLLDDNIFAEDFIKNLLNVCMDWNLENLNKDNKNFPGIDLGDKERHIGVQITSTKTSKKIQDSLQMIIDNGIEKEYNEIYFFILGKKQERYAIDYSKFGEIDCSNNNIWDISDIKTWCLHYDLPKIIKVWNVISQELANNSEDSRHKPIIVKKCMIELKQVLRSIFCCADTFLQNDQVVGNYTKKAVEVLENIDNLIPFLDETTYVTCKDIIGKGIELEKILTTNNGKRWLNRDRIQNILEYRVVEKNVQLFDEQLTSTEMVSMGIDLLIDGDELLERLTNLQIDKDILFKQFSALKFKDVLEKRICRKCNESIIVFFKDGRNYNSETISRLEQEGSVVVVFEKREQLTDYFLRKIEEKREIVIICSNEDLFHKIDYTREKKYIYTVNLKRDLVAHMIPLYFAIGNLDIYDIYDCFNYHEKTVININDITEQIFKDMIANANDFYSHQVRVDWSGNVYLSTITGAENIENVKFRWETWDAGNGYTGPFAASDKKYIQDSLKSLKKCWDDGVRGYCDYYSII